MSDFRKRLECEADSLRADDGNERFERQKKAARLRRWTDADGMWCLSGRFDPLTGIRLDAGLRAELEAAFAESVPDGCPTDPQAKSEFLAACALARIMDGDGVAQRAGRPEFVVVIEADDAMHASRTDRSSPPHSSPPGGSRAEHAGSELDSRFRGGDAAGGDTSDAALGPDSDDVRRPHVDWGLPVEIPWSVLVELFGDADVHPVIVRSRSGDRGSANSLRQLVHCVELGSPAIGGRSRFNAGRMQLLVTDDSLIVFVPNDRATHSTGFHLQHRTSAVRRRSLDPAPWAVYDTRS